jgi:hypothetical protein
MVISSGTFHLPNQAAALFNISISGAFVDPDSGLLRTAVEKHLENAYTEIYLNTLEISDIDLSGINEIIHCHHMLKAVSKKLIVLFRKGSETEKWLDTTGTGAFIATLGISGQL